MGPSALRTTGQDIGRSDSAIYGANQKNPKARQVARASNIANPIHRPPLKSHLTRLLMYSVFITSYGLVFSTPKAMADGFWYDMNDKKCKITWHNNDAIDYNGCSEWSYVGAKALGTSYEGSYNYNMYLYSGEECPVAVTVLGRRLSIRPNGRGGKCSKVFMLQRQ